MAVASGGTASSRARLRAVAGRDGPPLPSGGSGTRARRVPPRWSVRCARITNGNRGDNPIMSEASQRPTLVVVGTGMAGARVVEEVLAREPDRFAIRMFGAEPHGTYNRILLSSVLGGFHDPNELWINPLDWYESHGVFVHSGVRAETIDRHQRIVVGAGGKVAEPYDLLVLATGSRPFVPPLEGTKQQGVFVFRTLDDCATIGAYAENCERAVVLGGGLLGLEAA